MPKPVQLRQQMQTWLVHLVSQQSKQRLLQLVVSPFQFQSMAGQNLENLLNQLAVVHKLGLTLQIFVNSQSSIPQRPVKHRLDPGAQVKSTKVDKV